VLGMGFDYICANLCVTYRVYEWSRCLGVRLGAGGLGDEGLSERGGHGIGYGGTGWVGLDICTLTSLPTYLGVFVAGTRLD
jgi:hypothetical protein